MCELAHVIVGIIVDKVIYVRLFHTKSLKNAASLINVNNRSGKKKETASDFISLCCCFQVGKYGHGHLTPA